MPRKDKRKSRETEKFSSAPLEKLFFQNLLLLILKGCNDALRSSLSFVPPCRPSSGTAFPLPSFPSPIAQRFRSQSTACTTMKMRLCAGCRACAHRAHCDAQRADAAMQIAPAAHHPLAMVAARNPMLSCRHRRQHHQHRRRRRTASLPVSALGASFFSYFYSVYTTGIVVPAMTTTTSPRSDSGMPPRLDGVWPTPLSPHSPPSTANKRVS